MKWFLVLSGVVIAAVTVVGLTLITPPQSQSDTQPDELLPPAEPSEQMISVWFGEDVDQATDEETAAGYAVFATYCTPCHGLMGEGTDIGVPLNQPDVRSRDVSELIATIREGIPGTAMPTWGEILAPADIDAVANFLHSDDALVVERPFTTPNMADRETVALLDAALFDTMCATCHGAEGNGDEGPALNSLQILTSRTDEEITTTIMNGGWQVNSIMPAFADLLTTDQIDSLVAYIRGWEETAVWVENPRGMAQGGGSPWQQANWSGGQGQGRGRQGGGPWWRSESP